MKQAVVYIIQLLFLGALSSCHNHENALDEDAATTGRTISRDIPMSQRGDTDGSYKASRDAERYLNLGSLQDGFDQVQIRLWYFYGLTDTVQLVVLRRQHNRWKGTFYTYTFNYIDPLDERSGSYSTGASVTVQPKSGWSSYIDQLAKLHIKDLPDMDKLWNDGDSFTEPPGVTIEIATPHRYRLYTYEMPWEFQDRWWQAKNVVNILNLTDQELDLKRIRK
jgi:hypothetical protein